MRSGRGAWMRFPDVFGKSVSFKERIAGSRADNDNGRDREAIGTPWVLQPIKIHVSPYLCISSAPH